MEERNLTCINCPMGCFLTVKLDGDGRVADVAGNQCGRGVSYAKMEITNPVRVMTSTVRVRNAVHGALPVKSVNPVPKDRVAACVQALKSIDLEAPVALGQIVLADVCGTGVDIVATRDMAGKTTAG